MRRALALTIAVFLLGCGKTDPDKAQLQREIEQLRQAKAEAEAEKLAVQREIAAYRADLEHERFCNQELRHKLKELSDLRQIVEIAKGLPKSEPVAEQPAPPEPPAERPQPAPISAAIAVARALPDAQPPRPAPVAAPLAPAPARPMEEAKPPARKPKPEPKAPDPKPKPTPDTATVTPKPAQPPAPANAEAVLRKKTPPAPAATTASEPKLLSKPTPDPVEKPKTAEGPAAAKKADPAPAAATEAPKPIETPSPRVSAVGAEELQLLNLVNRREGNGLLLSGQVRNNTSLPAQNVVVTCKLYDKHSQVVREMRIPVGGGPVPAGATVEFRTETPWDARVSGCRFEVEGVQRVDVSRNN